MWRPKRLIGSLAVVAAGVAVAVFAFSPDAVTVETQRVARGPVRVSIEEEGQTRVRERYVVSAPTTGWMQRIACEEGDAVERGAMIGRIYPLPLDDRTRQQNASQLKTAESAHEETLARLMQAETRWQDQKKALARAESLAVRQLVAPVELQGARDAASLAELEVEAATSRVTAALHGVEAARAALLGARSTSGVPFVAVNAPVAGTVLRVHEECERPISAGAPIVEIGNLEDVEIVVDVLSGDATRIRHGARMMYFLDPVHSDTQFAVVRKVEPAAFTRVSPLGIEEQRVRVIADPVAAPPRGDRMRVDAEIILWEAADVVRAPTGALFRADDARWAVFVVESGRARVRPVDLGHRSPLFTEVVRGLNVGEQIVVFPPSTLTDGARVQPERPK